ERRAGGRSRSDPGAAPAPAGHPRAEINRRAGGQPHPGSDDRRRRRSSAAAPSQRRRPGRPRGQGRPGDASGRRPRQAGGAPAPHRARQRPPHPPFRGPPRRAGAARPPHAGALAMRRPLTFALFLGLCLSGAGFAAPAAPAADGSTDSAGLEGAVVGEIRVVNTSIFDPAKPGEDNRLFRLADRLHRTTRPEVISRQLTLRPGDRFTRAALEESERILRANDYLYDAHIRVIPSGDGIVDLEVETRDVWTLQGGISFNRAGEANTGSVHLEDNNFLGTGKELTLLRVNDIDRTSNVVRFRDPDLLGSRTRLMLSYADNSDGGRRRFEVDRPFYSLDARWATGVQAMLDNRVEPFYELGRITQRFRHEQDFAE